MFFGIDEPLVGQHTLQRVGRISLWCLSDDGAPPRSVQVQLDGRPAFALRHCFRGDVAEARPDLPRVGESGFFGDILIPSEIPNDRNVEVRVVAKFDGGADLILAEWNLVAQGAEPPAAPRIRSYDPREILAGEQEMRSREDAEIDRRDILGVPHFHRRGDLPILQLLHTDPTHPYSDSARNVIEGSHGGIFLDLGCGIKAPEDSYENAVLLDAIQFPGVDVVNSCTALPFRSGVFDAIISQAVFEHLPRPHQIAAECLRILKPGGLLLIDTAFMQPLHADPDHYFNMTSEGLRLVLDGFEIVEEGSRFYQYPSWSLRMQITEVMPHLKAGRWRNRLNALLEHVVASGAELDADLGPVGRKMLAAGVYALARKPL